MIKLQWIDSSSEVIDVDWPVSLQWTWDGAGPQPSAQVIIEVPQHLDLNAEDGGVLRELSRPDSNAADADAADGKGGAEAVRRLLMSTVRSADHTIRLRKSDGDSDHKIGLVIHVLGGPHLLTHESCREAGLTLRRASGQASFLYVAARCQPIHGGTVVTIQASDDAAIRGTRADSVESSSTTVKVMGDRQPSGVVTLVAKVDPDDAVQFEIVRSKPDGAADSSKNALAAESGRGSKRRRTTPVPASPPAAEAEPRASQTTWTIDAGLAHVAYVGRTTNPGELNLEVAAKVERTLDGSQRYSLVGETRLPLTQLVPSVLHFPASGFYRLDGGVRAALLTKPAFELGLSAGPELGVTTLASAQASTGFLAGPQASIDARGRSAALGDRAWSARFFGAPLAGRGLSPAFNSFALGGETTLEAARPTAGERRWDVLLRLDYAKLKQPSGYNAELTDILLGARLWF